MLYYLFILYYSIYIIIYKYSQLLYLYTSQHNGQSKLSTRGSRRFFFLVNTIYYIEILRYSLLFFMIFLINTLSHRIIYC